MALIDVVIQTWPNHPQRLEYFSTTVEAAMRFLTASDDELSFRVSSESHRCEDSAWCSVALEAQCKRWHLPLHYRSSAPDIGAHLNEIWRTSTADLLFLLQDDWELLRPLDISAGARRIRDKTVGVRYWAHTDYQGENDNGFVQVKRDAIWSYGDNPALWGKSFHASLGPFHEGGQLGRHEIDMYERLGASNLTVLAASELERDSSYWFRHLGRVTTTPRHRSRIECEDNDRP